jgi:hypothetical protein
MLPLLIILFLISYGLLTLLVVQQDRKIDSQRSLIHLLFKDNVHLSALRGGQNRLGYAADTAASHARSLGGQSLAAQSSAAQSSHAISSQAPLANQVPLIQVPAGSNQVTSNQIMSNQVTSTQIPESQARTQANAKGAKARKAQKQLPVPPVEITDPSDTRRVSFSI